MVGETGGTVRFPVTNVYTNAATVGEGTSIASAATSTLEPTAVDCALVKRGVASDVTLESLSDAGYDLVYRATLQRLSGGLAESSDSAGFLVALAAFTTEVGTAGTASTEVRNTIFSPDSLGYAVKDSGPMVETFYNVDTQIHEFRASIREGYAAIKPNFGVRMTASKVIGGNVTTIGADVSSLALGTSTLRNQSAPTLDNGNYIAVVDPAFEFALNQQVALAGGDAAVGSLSDIGNRAFYDGLVGQCVGVSLWRSNSLPDADEVA
jgi:hypothetical protein